MMWRGKVLLGTSIAFVFWIFFPVSVRSDVDTKSLEQSLVCTCGCGNMILFTCMCEDAERMRAEIRGLIDEGKDEDEIVQILVGKYGEIILAAPVQEGFNLTAYVMPFVAILVAGGLLLSFIRRWRRDVIVAAARIDPETPAGDDPYRRKLEEELKSFRD